MTGMGWSLSNLRPGESLLHTPIKPAERARSVAWGRPGAHAQDGSWIDHAAAELLRTRSTPSEQFAHNRIFNAADIVEPISPRRATFDIDAPS